MKVLTAPERRDLRTLLTRAFIDQHPDSPLAKGPAPLYVAEAFLDMPAGLRPPDAVLVEWMQGPLVRSVATEDTVAATFKQRASIQQATRAVAEAYPGRIGPAAYAAQMTLAEARAAIGTGNPGAVRALRVLAAFRNTEPS